MPAVGLVTKDFLAEVEVFCSMLDGRPVNLLVGIIRQTPFLMSINV
jgi:hypothetical protein